MTQSISFFLLLLSFSFVLSSCEKKVISAPVTVKSISHDQVVQAQQVIRRSLQERHRLYHSEKTFQKLISQEKFERNVAFMHQNIDQEKSIFLGAYNSTGQLVGVTLSFPIDHSHYYMRWLFIVPSVQRQGVGSRLFDQTLTEIKRIQPGTRQLILEVLEKNVLAQNFYKKKGMKLIKKRPQSDYMAHVLSLDL